MASRRAALHDIMALSYGPARGLAYDRRRGFRAWVDRDDRHGRNFCLVRCNAHKHVQALPKMPRHGVNTVDAPLQERVKSGKNCIVLISVIENPPKSGYSTESGHICILWYISSRLLLFVRRVVVSRVVPAVVQVDAAVSSAHLRERVAAAVVAEERGLVVGLGVVHAVAEHEEGRLLYGNGDALQNALDPDVHERREVVERGLRGLPRLVHVQPEVAVQLLQAK